MKKRNINLHFNKVKAHAGSIYNEKADQLVKQATREEIIEWNKESTYKIKTLLIWHNITIDMAMRDFVKEINNKQLMDKWSNQRRIQKTFKEQLQGLEDYDWKSLWENIQAKGMTTSIKDNKKRSFWLKLIHNELLTLNKLTIRRSDLYGQNRTCPLCNKEKETREHIFKCKELESRIIQV